MIGPNAVATNGHMLYNKSNGGDNWITSATITPARKSGSNSAPYGSAKAIAYECGGNWVKNADYKDDWGVITLNKNIGDNVGWLGLKWQSASYNGTNVMVNGYPSTVRGVNTWDQYRSDGKIDVSNPRSLISYSIDATGGNSGGPCYVFSGNTGYTAIGILQGGGSENDTYTNILRIDQWIYNKLISFRTSRV